MQPELIETFIDLIETGNFNRTAERLGVTQSTVSGRVKALEAALECQVFTRGRSGASLTTHGLRFEPHARMLRHSWAEALHDIRTTSPRAMVLRISLQHDLAGNHIGDWLVNIREALPGTGLYLEADFSTQMCNFLIAGNLDLGVIFTPKPHPDLHFETLGEVTYSMVSSHTDSLRDVTAENYILANYAPAFSRVHAALHPGLSAAPVGGGQHDVVAGLLTTLGGSAYVLEPTARDLIASGRFQRVNDAPVIPQSVYAAIHLRHRHRALHRRMIAILRAYVTRQGSGIAKTT